MTSTPIRCAVGALYYDGQILLGKRSPQRRMYPNYWDLIGGHCHPGEILEQTLQRELSEEVGIRATSFQLIDVLTEPCSDTYGVHEYHVFAISKWIGTATNRQAEEHSEIGWFSFRDAERLELAHPRYPVLIARIERLPVRLAHRKGDLQ